MSDIGITQCHGTAAIYPPARVSSTCSRKCCNFSVPLICCAMLRQLQANSKVEGVSMRAGARLVRPKYLSQVQKHSLCLHVSTTVLYNWRLTSVTTVLYNWRLTSITTVLYDWRLTSITTVLYDWRLTSLRPFFMTGGSPVSCNIHCDTKTKTGGLHCPAEKAMSRLGDQKEKRKLNANLRQIRFCESVWIN